MHAQCAGKCRPRQGRCSIDMKEGIQDGKNVFRAVEKKGCPRNMHMHASTLTYNSAQETKVVFGSAPQRYKPRSIYLPLQNSPSIA